MVAEAVSVVKRSILSHFQEVHYLRLKYNHLVVAYQLVVPLTSVLLYKTMTLILWHCYRINNQCSTHRTIINL